MMTRKAKRRRKTWKKKCFTQMIENNDLEWEVLILLFFSTTVNDLLEKKKRGNLRSANQWKSGYTVTIHPSSISCRNASRIQNLVIVPMLRKELGTCVTVVSLQQRDSPAVISSTK
jgi:hypothetical protein